jgi:PadR family transcriptional regulator, regulatory protein PadR
VAETIRPTTAVAKVLTAFLVEPDAERYGLELMRATRHPSGTLYPILIRLERAGWVRARWEQIDAVQAERPARRYYRLTAHGVASARVELAALRQQLGIDATPSPARIETKPA